LPLYSFSIVISHPASIARFCNIHCFQGKVITLMLNLNPVDQGLPFIWPLPIKLSNMGDPSRRLCSIA
jgi:hypothetical protein